MMLGTIHDSIQGAAGVWQEGQTYKVDIGGTVRDVTDVEILQASKATHLTEIRTEAATLIESKWPAWRQNNCALGVYPDTVVTECADDIAAVIAASNTAEDLVEAATTVTEVEAVTPVWPVL